MAAGLLNKPEKSEVLWTSSITRCQGQPGWGAAAGGGTLWAGGDAGASDRGLAICAVLLMFSC